MSNTVLVTLDYVKQYFTHQIPLVFLVVGSIGFLGNALTFLQVTLRRNTFCLYSLCGSVIDLFNLFVNLLPNYLEGENNTLVLISTTAVCKWKLFVLVFLPQLSMNLLILSLIDRYACACSLTSPLRRVLQLKTVPWSLMLAVLVSGLSSLYSFLLYDMVPGYGCSPTNALLNGIFYIVVHGLFTPMVMLVFVWLTYRNLRRSRQRVGVVTHMARARHPFISMVFTQVLSTSFFTLQWISFYIYHIVTLGNERSAEQWTVHYFLFSLSNTLYYVNNIKSFYLSTLTSRLFRQTFVQIFR